MSIPNYVRPQLTIEQLLQELPAATTDRLTAIVIGPQYLLSRYGKETLVASTEFDTGIMTISYEYYDDDGALQSLPATYTVDTDSVEVDLVGGEISLATYTAAGTDWTVESAANSNVLVLGTNNVSGGTLNTDLRGREVAVGDLVYVSESDAADAPTKRRVVTALEGVDVAASKGTNTDKDDDLPSGSAYNPADDATADASEQLSAPAGYTVTTSGTLDVCPRGGSLVGTGNKLGEEFTVTVTQTATSGVATDGLVNITSLSGDYAATGVVPANDAGNFDISDTETAGITIKINGGGSDLTVGQVFKVRVYQAYERLTMGLASSATENPAGVHFGVWGTYTGTSDTTYIVKVTTGTAAGSGIDAAVLEITDTAGLETLATHTIDVALATDAEPFSLGTLGLTGIFEFDGTGDPTQDALRAGDVYYIHAVAATQSTTEFDKVVLDGPAVDTTTWDFVAPAYPKVEFRLEHTGEILSTDAADGTAWTATTSNVTIDAGLAIYVADRDTGYQWVSLVDAVGDIYVSYRALLPAPTTEDRIAIETVSDISDELGTVDLDNDLAYGANECLSGANGKRIYALRTAGTTLADYAAALKKIESTDTVYALCPLTDDSTIQQAVATHCESMSQKNIKNFRRCYVGTDSPGSYLVLNSTTNGSLTATVSEYNGENLLVTTADDQADFTTRGMQNGDIVKIMVSGGVFTDFLLDQVVSDTELLLQAGPGAPISPAVPVELWRADTADSQVDYVVARSAALGSRRAVNVWVDNGTNIIDNVATTIPNRFVAAEIAGLRTSILPQQGLTMTEIQSVTNAASMYTKYNNDDLDRAAASGTFIITQEVESGAVFIRHQLTTETDKGSLYYEDSVGVNLDDISFQVKDTLTGYIGKKNVTAQTLQEIDSDVWTIMINATQTDSGVEYGPQLNGFQDADGNDQRVTVKANDTLKDRVEVYALLEMPLPLNVIEVVLEASVDFDL